MYCILRSISTLIRKLGGFFIRRKLDEMADGKKDVLYRSLLHAVSRVLFEVLETIIHIFLSYRTTQQFSCSSDAFL